MDKQDSNSTQLETNTHHTAREGELHAGRKAALSFLAEELQIDAAQAERLLAVLALHVNEVRPYKEPVDRIEALGIMRDTLDGSITLTYGQSQYKVVMNPHTNLYDLEEVGIHLIDPNQPLSKVQAAARFAAMSSGKFI